MRKAGFTLLEVSMALTILSVVSLLSFIVLRSSTESASLSQAKADVQASLRDVMTVLSDEVRSAYTDRTVASQPPIAPEDTQSIFIDEDGTQLTCQVPIPTGTATMVTASSPIVFRWENEDLASTTGLPNARLDPGEDTNGDGALTRRVVREQSGVTTVVGAANNISNLQFQLLSNAATEETALTKLRIHLEATKRYGEGEGKWVRAQLETTIDLAN